MIGQNFLEGTFSYSSQKRGVKEQYVKGCLTKLVSTYVLLKKQKVDRKSVFFTHFLSQNVNLKC